MQEDLASAEAELAGWYETMQRETNALKRLYRQDPTHEPLDPLSAAQVGSDHAGGPDSLAAQGAAESTEPERAVPDWLTKGKQQMASVEKGNGVAARQQPQVSLEAGRQSGSTVCGVSALGHVWGPKARGGGREGDYLRGAVTVPGLLAMLLC